MNKKRNILFFVFIIPIVVSYLTELILQGNNEQRFNNFLEHIFFATIIISISFLLKRRAIENFYLKSAYVLFCLMLFFETVFYYYFKGSFNASAMFIMLETNVEEVKEFLSSYVDTTTIILVFIYLFLLVFGLFVLKRSAEEKKNLRRSIAIGLIFVLSIILKASGLIENNLPYSITKGVSVYINEIGKFDKIKNFTDVQHTKAIEEELYIVLLGESVSRLHFQLYGQYYRETTPLLSEIKDELLVMTDVISPHTYTIASLTKGLTLSDAQNPDGKFDGSIIQLLNQAGFKTYWISNQRPIGISDTQVTRIASAAHETIFLNDKHTSENTPYDEVVFNKFEKVLKENVDKKVVFVHMIGSHKEYAKRYPPSFNFFKTPPISKFGSENSYQHINTYDNSIRYTDSVVRNIIELVRKENAMSYVLYLSDHGQEVYDEIEFHGQTNDQMVTKNMYEIPFFLWTSKMYQKNNSINQNLNKKYMTDDLIHTIADLSNVHAREIDSSRSIFNINFKEQKRLIKDGEDYDKLFELEKQ